MRLIKKVKIEFMTKKLHKNNIYNQVIIHVEIKIKIQVIFFE